MKCGLVEFSLHDIMWRKDKQHAKYLDLVTAHNNIKRQH